MKHPIIDKILTEWSHRVHDGMPDVKNPMHLIHLRESLEHLKIDEEVIDIMMNKLYEGKPKEVPDKVKKDAKKKGLQWKQKGYGPPGKGKGITHKVDYDRGRLVPVDSDEEKPKMGGDEEKPKPETKIKIVKPKQSGGFEIDDDGGLDIDVSNPVDKLRSEFGDTYITPLDMNKDAFMLKNKHNQTKDVYILPDGIKNNPKIPKRYTQLLERALNTNRNADDNTDNADYYGLVGVGAGNLESNLGELMTMMATTLRRKDRQEFFNGLDEHLAKVKYNEQVTHVQPQWVKAAKENSGAILRLFYDLYGKEYEIQAGAWDVEDEVRDMGLDYSKKGFSTDIFFKLKTKLGDVFPEISLKQALQANLFNTTVGAAFNEIELPIDLQPSTFSSNEVANNDNYYSNNQYNIKEFINNIDVTSKDFKRLAKKVSMVMSNNRPIQADKIVIALKEMIINAQEDLLTDENLVIDRNYVGSIRQAGATKKSGVTEAKSEILKPMMMLSRMMSRMGDDTATEFVKAQDKLGKDYAKGVLRHIDNDATAKEAVLKMIQKKLPLKSISDGEEDIVLGEYNLTKKTLKGIFGTDNWDEIKENLKIDSEIDPPVIKYSGTVRGTTTEIPISFIGVREDGIGYRGGHKFEMKLDPSFAKRVKSVSNSIYAAQEEIPYPVGILEPGTREPVGN